MARLIPLIRTAIWTEPLQRPAACHVCARIVGLGGQDFIGHAQRLVRLVVLGVLLHLRGDLCVDMCGAMGGGVKVGMRVEMCLDMHSASLSVVILGVPPSVDVCTDMCLYRHVDVCVDTCALRPRVISESASSAVT